ncbi:hypothetical protein [uncultured Tyzzerella sp.]|uniref:hypothetical protein n=1 Tax=uncultured Tyzzerella sp. TaxID=2321398 RepID=UPI0029424E85|nr:hypothetical protein [uncultured Tyzzerella sp.]
MKIGKRELLYLVPIVIVFYGLPVLIKDMGMAILSLLVIMPSVCFLSSIMYSLNKKSNILYPIICTIIYIPTIFIYYNLSATIYIFIYAIILFLGYIIGKLIMKILKM